MGLYKPTNTLIGDDKILDDTSPVTDYVSKFGQITEEDVRYKKQQDEARQRILEAKEKEQERLRKEEERKKEKALRQDTDGSQTIMEAPIEAQVLRKTAEVISEEATHAVHAFFHGGALGGKRMSSGFRKLLDIPYNTALRVAREGADVALQTLGLSTSYEVPDRIEEYAREKEEKIDVLTAIWGTVDRAVQRVNPFNIEYHVPGLGAIEQAIHYEMDQVVKRHEEEYDPEKIVSRVTKVLTEEALAFVPTIVASAPIRGVQVNGGFIKNFLVRQGMYTGAVAATTDHDLDVASTSGLALNYFNWVNTKTLGMSMGKRIGITLAAAQAFTGFALSLEMGRTKADKLLNPELHDHDPNITSEDLEQTKARFLEESLMNVVQSLGELVFGTRIYPHKKVSAYVQRKIEAKEAADYRELLQSEFPSLYDAYVTATHTQAMDAMSWQGRMIRTDEHGLGTFYDDLRTDIFNQSGEVPKTRDEVVNFYSSSSKHLDSLAKLKEHPGWEAMSKKEQKQAEADYKQRALDEAEVFVNTAIHMDHIYHANFRSETNQPGVHKEEGAYAAAGPSIFKNVGEAISYFAGKYRDVRPELRRGSYRPLTLQGKTFKRGAANASSETTGERIFFPDNFSETRLRKEFEEIVIKKDEWFAHPSGTEEKIYSHAFEHELRNPSLDKDVLWAVTAHETGHSIHQTYWKENPRARNEWYQIYIDLGPDWIKKNISTRAADTPQEFFAETFYMHERGMNRFLPRAVKDYFADHLVRKEPGTFEDLRDITLAQITAATGDSSAKKYLAARTDISVMRKAYHTFFGEDLMQRLHAAMGGKIDTHTHAAITSNYLRMRDKTPLEIHTLEKDMGWSDTILKDPKEKEFLAHFGTWWRSMAEWQHLNHHPQDRGKGSPFGKRVKKKTGVLSTKELLQKAAGTDNPAIHEALDSRQRAEEWMRSHKDPNGESYFKRANKMLESLMDFKTKKLMEAVEAGLITEKEFNRLDWIHMPRFTTDDAIHIFESEYRGKKLTKETQEGVYDAKSFVKFLTANREMDASLLINDPRTIMEFFVMSSNAAIGQNKRLRALHDWIIKHPEKAANINMYKKLPKDKMKSDFRQVTFVDKRKKGQSKSKFWLHAPDFEMLGLEPMIIKDGLIGKTIGNATSLARHMVTKYDPFFAMYRWLPDTRNSYENMRLPMKSSWMVPGVFESKLAWTQKSMLNKKERAHWMKQANEAGLVLQARSSYAVKGRQDFVQKRLKHTILNLQRKQGFDYETFTANLEKSELGLSVGALRDLPVQMNEFVHNTRTLALFKMYREAHHEGTPTGMKMTDSDIAAAINEHQNFREHGTAVPQMENYFMFANAILRDVDAAWKAVRYNPKQSAAKAAGYVSAVAFHELMATIMNPEYRKTELVDRSMSIIIPFKGKVEDGGLDRMPHIRLPLDNFLKPAMILNVGTRMGVQKSINQLIQWANEGKLNTYWTEKVYGMFGDEVVPIMAAEESVIKNMAQNLLLNRGAGLGVVPAMAIVGLTSKSPEWDIDYGSPGDPLVNPGLDYDPTKVMSISAGVGESLQGTPVQNILTPPVVDQALRFPSYNSVLGFGMQAWGNNPNFNLQSDPYNENWEFASKTPLLSKLFKTYYFKDGVLSKEVEMRNDRYYQQVERPLLMIRKDFESGYVDKAAKHLGEILNAQTSKADKLLVWKRGEQLIRGSVLKRAMKDWMDLSYEGDSRFDEHTFSVMSRYLRKVSKTLDPKESATFFVNRLTSYPRKETKAAFFLLAKNYELFNTQFYSELKKHPQWQEEKEELKKGVGVLKKELTPVYNRRAKEYYSSMGKYQSFLTLPSSFFSL